MGGSVRSAARVCRAAGSVSGRAASPLRRRSRSAGASDVRPLGEQHPRQAEDLEDPERLGQDRAGPPRDPPEDLRDHRARPDQVVPAVGRGAEDEVAVAEQLEGALEDLDGQGRGVRADDRDPVVAGREKTCDARGHPLAEIVPLLPQRFDPAQVLAQRRHLRVGDLRGPRDRGPDPPGGDAPQELDRVPQERDVDRVRLLRAEARGEAGLRLPLAGGAGEQDEDGTGGRRFHGRMIARQGVKRSRAARDPLLRPRTRRGGNRGAARRGLQCPACPTR